MLLLLYVYKHVSAASCLPYRYIWYYYYYYVAELRTDDVRRPTCTGGCTTFERARGSCNGAALWEIGRSNVAAVTIINDKSAGRLRRFSIRWRPQQERMHRRPNIVMIRERWTEICYLKRLQVPTLRSLRSTAYHQIMRKKYFSYNDTPNY